LNRIIGIKVKGLYLVLLTALEHFSLGIVVPFRW